MGKATAPRLFGIKAWYDDNFYKEVEQHDQDYVDQVLTRKMSDCHFAAAIIKAGYWWRGLAAYVYCRSLGWFFWYRRKLKNAWKQSSLPKRGVTPNEYEGGDDDNA
jgi:hypothetical protein